jgi:PAS domain S-box-containing protein
MTGDELGNLAKAFNVMTADLADLYSRLELEGRERGAILQSSFDGIALADKNGTLIYDNPGMQRLFGYSVREVPSLAVLADRIFDTEEDRQSFVVNLMSDMTQEDPPERVFPFLHRDGGQCWCRMKVSRMPGARGHKRPGRQRALVSRSVRHMALHDSLTGLPNRQLFVDRLKQALRRARRNNIGVGLLFVDLDHFKSLNDTYGHAHGDRVLMETALRLKACVRESDTVARLGGDEFVIVLPDLAGAKDAEAVAEKVLGALFDPKVADGKMFLGAFDWAGLHRSMARTRTACSAGPTRPCMRPSEPEATPSAWPERFLLLEGSLLFDLRAGLADERAQLGHVHRVREQES